MQRFAGLCFGCVFVGAADTGGQCASNKRGGSDGTLPSRHGGTAAAMVGKPMGSKINLPQGLQPSDAMRALYDIIDAIGFRCILQVRASCK